MHEHNVIINNIAPEGSVCGICNQPAKWQMYCDECGYILRFFCDKHAYLSQGDAKLESQVKKAYKNQTKPKEAKQIKAAKDEWQKYLEEVNFYK